MSMSSSSSTHPVELIRKKFEKCEYSVDNIPQLLTMSNRGVYVNKDAPNLNIVDFIERLGKTEVKNNLLTPKLIATFGNPRSDANYDWDACIQKVPKSYFKSREVLEDLMIDKCDRVVGAACIQAARLSMREAISNIFILCSCDMRYYLANKSELEADLDRPLSPELDLNDKQVLEKLEQELFYINMCKIFGPEIDDDKIEIDGKDVLYEKSFMLKDFNVLSSDGNEIQAVAERGEDYLMFFNTF